MLSIFLHILMLLLEFSLELKQLPFFSSSPSTLITAIPRISLSLMLKLQLKDIHLKKSLYKLNYQFFIYLLLANAKNGAAVHQVLQIFFLFFFRQMSLTKKTISSIESSPNVGCLFWSSNLTFLTLIMQSEIKMKKNTYQQKPLENKEKLLL